mmetsp:Transcript_8321/g.27709  ORF Transcript_8321/g.27709 Transcript_8321/m.27709 type:complete len:321 (+) Transcript_8321:708-1670(+)
MVGRGPTIPSPPSISSEVNFGHSVTARSLSFGANAFTPRSDAHRANRSLSKFGTCACVSGDSLDHQFLPVRSSLASQISSARSAGQALKNTRTSSSLTLAAPPTAKRVRLGVNSPAVLHARGTIVHACRPRVTSVDTSTLSTGITPRAPEVRAFSFNRVARGSTHAWKSAELASAQNVSVAGSTALIFLSDFLSDSVASLQSFCIPRDHGAVNTWPPASAGGHSTKRFSRPGRCLVTTAATIASACPGTPSVSGGVSFRACQTLDDGPNIKQGTHRASSRSTLHATARCATQSASTFAITTRSATRVALFFSSCSNEFPI